MYKGISDNDKTLFTIIVTIIKIRGCLLFYLFSFHLFFPFSNAFKIIMMCKEQLQYECVYFKIISSNSFAEANSGSVKVPVNISRSGNKMDSLISQVYNLLLLTQMSYSVRQKQKNRLFRYLCGDVWKRWQLFFECFQLPCDGA